MKVLGILTLTIGVSASGILPAQGQTVIVPETPLSHGSPTNASTALIDLDSVFVAYTRTTPPFLDSTTFQVVNINTGAIESAATTFLPPGLREPTVGVLGWDRVFLATRDDFGHTGGKYFVVNPTTGAIVRGPVPFTAFDTPINYRVAVADSSTVLLAYNGDNTGRFTVVDPQNGAVKVPETEFEPDRINTIDAAMIDGNRAALVYGHWATGLIRVVILNVRTGAILNGPVDLTDLGVGTVGRVLNLNSTQILIAYVEDDNVSSFVTFNTTTGVLGPRTRYGSPAGAEAATSPALLGSGAVFLPFAAHRPQGPGQFVVTDFDGRVLVPEMSFNPESHITGMSTTARGCRVFLFYSDGEGVKFQIIDFSDVCTPPPCPPDVTSQVNVFRTEFVPFFSPFLQLQLVLVQNLLSQPIPGPLAFATDSLENGLLFSSTATICPSPPPAPFVLIHPGADELLSPGEIVGGFLLFLKTAPDSIAYTPRVLAGSPPQ